MEEQLQSSWDKLSNKLTGWLDAVILSLPNFLIALVVFSICYWLSRVLQGWMSKFLKRFIKQPSIRGLLSNIASVVVIILGMLLALSILNLDGTLRTLLTGAGVAGLAISLALQGVLSNSFSGLFIALKDEINIGDWIETNGFSGRVVEIDLRNTKIKEGDNNIVVVPNKTILDNPFRNFGLTKRVRVKINCGVGYESDLKQVKEIAIEAIENVYQPNTGEDVEFFYTNFGDSSIDFIIRFWVDAQDAVTILGVQSGAIMAIKEAFDQHDINIPFPIRTLIHENLGEKQN